MAFNCDQRAALQIVLVLLQNLQHIFAYALGANVI